MSEGHTPGPWRVAEVRHEWDCIIRGPDNGPIASTFVAGYAKRTAKANAQIIASAPEMYEALKEIVEAVARTTSGEVCQLGDFSAARDALAKASGKEPAKT